MNSCLKMLYRASRRCRMLREESGNALVEMALLVSFFGLPFVLGTVEISLVLHSGQEIAEAANSGASYAMASLGNSTNTAGITVAAQGAAPDLASLQVTSIAFYACSQSADGTQYATQAAANVACPTGSSNHPLYFVQVSTSAIIAQPYRVPGLPSTFTLAGKAVREVEE